MCLLHQQQDSFREWGDAVHTAVHFRTLTDQEIEAYVATGEPMGKAGAYGVQGRAAAYISRLSGSYSGIMGLPMFETAELLRCFGFTV